MFNAGRYIIYNSFDQLRFYAALNYQFNALFSIETNYIFAIQHPNKKNRLTIRDILRFTLVFRFKE